MKRAHTCVCLSFLNFNNCTVLLLICCINFVYCTWHIPLTSSSKLSVLCCCSADWMMWRQMVSNSLYKYLCCRNQSIRFVPCVVRCWWFTFALMHTCDNVRHMSLETGPSTTTTNIILLYIHSSSHRVCVWRWFGAVVPMLTRSGRYWYSMYSANVCAQNVQHSTTCLAWWNKL